METRRGFYVDSPIGRLRTDGDGSPEGAVRMDTTKSYVDEPAKVFTASFGGGKEVWNRIAG